MVNLRHGLCLDLDLTCFCCYWGPMSVPYRRWQLMRKENGPRKRFGWLKLEAAWIEDNDDYEMLETDCQKYIACKTSFWVYFEDSTRPLFDPWPFEHFEPNIKICFFVLGFSVLFFFFFRRANEQRLAEDLRGT